MDAAFGFVYDVLFVALVLVMAFNGMRRGLLSGLVGLGGLVAGVAGGAWATRQWALQIYQEHIGVSIGEQLANTLAGYGDDLTAALDELPFLPQALRDTLAGILQSASGDVVPQMVNALEPVILPLVQGLVFLVSCLLIRLVVRLLGRALRGVNHLPLLGTANKILGFALGFVTGLLDCWLVAMALWLLAGMTAGNVPALAPATLAQSAVYRFLANFNPFLGPY